MEWVVRDIESITFPWGAANSRGHCAGAPFFNSAGQLTITVSGCAACSGVARTRKRWPSGVVS